jgi:2-polyprenyl-6-methoxyphenol hydroxylase-like FAD-dependent oxidoreductase
MTERCSCCIAGGGPAGMMLGLLLARAGVDVMVLEKHADFLRDFRGDTIHPSTLEVMRELGMLDDLLKLPHQEVRAFSAQAYGELVPIADFSHLPTHCKFIAFMPQWDFLDFLAAKAARYPSFHLRKRAEVVGLVEEAGRVVGVEVVTPGGMYAGPRGPRRRRGRPSLGGARAGGPRSKGDRRAHGRALVQAFEAAGRPPQPDGHLRRGADLRPD